MLNFDNVSLRRDGRDVINGVSFNVKKGDFVALIGANGAGKTTLSKLCNGLLKPSGGTVTVNGFDTMKTPTSRIAKFTGFLFQNPDRQICQNTVRAEIYFGLDCVLDDKDEAKRRTEETLVRFSFDGDKDPFTLSRGERQILVLASLLAVRPQLLLLDEPTTGLDYRECIKVMGLVEEINKRGTTVLMVTHDMEIVQDFAKRVMVLNDGRLLACGETSEMMRDTEILDKAALLPPQITGLALRLGEGFRGVSTVGEMSAKIAAMAGKK